MIRRVYVRPDAETDIEEAVQWYESRREGLGDQFLERVHKTIKIISEMPEIYPVVQRDTRRATIHRFPFCMYYRVQKSVIVVLAVMHGSRHPRRWRGRIPT